MIQQLQPDVLLWETSREVSPYKPEVHNCTGCQWGSHSSVNCKHRWLLEQQRLIILIAFRQSPGGRSLPVIKKQSSGDNKMGNDLLQGNKEAI